MVRNFQVNFFGRHSKIQKKKRDRGKFTCCVAKSFVMSLGNAFKFNGIVYLLINLDF